MNWYIAKIIFGITAENSDHKPQFDEQLRLIVAENQEEAFMKAKMIGLTEEDSFINDKKNRVRWEFINVADIVALPALEDGVEVYSHIHEMEDADPYINFIHQKAITLRLNSRPLF